MVGRSSGVIWVDLESVYTEMGMAEKCKSFGNCVCVGGVLQA